MPTRACPNKDCEKIIDIDGYVEHRPALFYCECGRIYDMREFMKLVEVPKTEVNLSGLEGQHPIPAGQLVEYASRGIFIKKSRWSKATA